MKKKGCLQSAGTLFYKSIDEGVSWVQLQDFGGGCGPMDILFGTNFSVLTVKGSNRGIWSSIGDLVNWQQKVINFDPNSVTKDIYGNISSDKVIDILDEYE